MVSDDVVEYEARININNLFTLVLKTPSFRYQETDSGSKFFFLAARAIKVFLNIFLCIVHTNSVLKIDSIITSWELT